MIGLREAMGRTVVARDSAETMGDLAGAVVDAASRRIVALQVGKGHKAKLVDWTSVVGLGADAVVVEGADSLRDPDGEREPAVVKGDIALLGARVLTDRGDELGRLDDVEVDPATGEVLTLVTGEIRVPGPGLRALGHYAIVVSPS